MEKTKNTKRELKIVFSSEIYDELKYVFRKDQLENIIYRPMIIDEKRWQCSCGFETETEVCPICGMEKNTVFSKVNANYLIRHRKARLARHSKANESKKVMMAQMIKPTKKQKQKQSNKKIGSLIGVLCLCVALIVSVVIIFGSGNTEKPPVTQTTDKNTTNTPESTPKVTDTATGDKSPESTPGVSDTTNTPATEAPSTDAPTTEAPVTDNAEPIIIQNIPTNANIATLAVGKWATGASGNTSMGGLVYSAAEFDYIAKDGITVFDKNGKKNSTLTTNKALFITGSDKYIFYIAEDNSLHRIDLETKTDIAFGIKAATVTSTFERLYYTPANEKGLYSCNYDGNNKQVLTDKEVFALNATADKLYFSTSESLCVLSSKDSPVNTFCADGAYATSIIEITNCIFYTAKDGKLKYYNPNKPIGYSVEYPVYIGNVTAVVAYENRIYIRVEYPDTQKTLWRSTTWQEGTKLFDVNKFVSTGITTSSLFVTNNAVFDGQLNRVSIK